MNVIITGCSGFIGSHATRYFLARDHKVIGIDSSSAKNVDEFLKDGNFHLFKSDISFNLLLERLDLEVDAIVHLAAFNSIPESILHPHSFIKNNTMSMQMLLEFAKLRNIKRFVYASSSSIMNSVPSPYSISKQMNELQAKTYSIHYGLEAIGLRFFNIFGPKQKYKTPNSPVIPKLIYQLLKNEDIILREPDRVSRDFTYVDNACQAIYKAATKEGLTQDVFNVGCGESVSLQEVFEFIRNNIRMSSSQVTNKSLRLGEKSFSKADISRTIDHLDYMPLVDWKTGVLRTIGWLNEEIKVPLV